MSKNPNLTDDTQKFIDNLASHGSKPLYELSPDEARHFLENLQQKYYKNVPADVEDKTIKTPNYKVPVRIFKPQKVNKNLPAILYIHGGGWILGSKNSWDRFLRQLAIHTNSVIIFPEYSRSPQATYPQALNEIYETLEYIYKKPEEFNINSARIVIAGDSVGGNMATVTTLRSLIENGPKIIFQLLFYPVTNSEMDTESYKEFSDGPWLTKKAMEWFWDAYEPDRNKRKHPYLSPINATNNELKNMPPVMIITAENDVLRDEGEAYAKKLDQSGVTVSNIRINGTIHDFMVLNAIADSQPAKIGFLTACAKLKQVFDHTI